MRRFAVIAPTSETDWYHFEIPLTEVSLDHDEYDAVHDWCVDHFGASDAEVDRCGFSRRWYGVYAEDRFSFRLRDDAMLFKIRWC